MRVPVTHGWFYRSFLPYLLTSTGIDIITFQTCCDMGLKSAMEQNSCEVTEPANGIEPEDQTLCLSVIELCCARKIREMDCEDGKDVAINGGNCPLLNTTDEQHCCESCKLGLITRSMGGPCYLGETTFGKLWDAAFYSCCSQSDAVSSEAQRMETDNVCEMLEGELCAHICVPVPGSYLCECHPGYSLMTDKKGCEKNSRCSGNTCSQLCEETEVGFRCYCYDGYQLEEDNFTCTRIYPIDPACESGYELNRIAKVCQDVDECLNNPCGEGEACVNTKGSYLCEQQVKPTNPPAQDRTGNIPCPVGYQASSNSHHCEDVDECEDNPCDSTQLCVNTMGSFFCKCKTGFQRDNFTEGCVDINECQVNPTVCSDVERCDNSAGSYNCVRLTSCGTGYTLNQHTNRCEDDDECALGTDTCRVIGWGCKNEKGSFRCIKNRTRVHRVYTCPSGYTLDSSKTKCIDVNECVTGRHNCKTNQLCVNTAGGFTCSSKLECQPGFRLQNDGPRCNDINECVETPELCSQRCINTWGSFRCGCNAGYELLGDNRTCVDTNECLMETDRRRLCMGICVNQPGSYSCSCPPGYELSADNFSCSDVDECRYNVCAENEVCTNVRGSYRCTDMTCQTGFVKDRYKNNKCIRNCKYSDDGCRAKPISYTVHFISLVSNMTLPPAGFRFFKMGTTSSSSRADFELQEPESDAAPSTERANREHFRLESYFPNSAMLIMQKPLEGPQDVHLTVKMSYFDDSIYLGFTVINIELFVSQYTF